MRFAQTPRTSLTAIVFGVSLLFTTLPFFAGAQQYTLPPGVRAATAEDLPFMEAAGIPDPVVGMWWEPTSQYVGKASGEAKQFLKSLPRSGSAKTDDNIEMLNTQFATCSATFLRSFQANHGPVIITSAYRSPAFEAQLCIDNPNCGALMNVANPNGNHQRGLALDVQTLKQSTMIDYARRNPQFGVCFPFTGEGGGFKDEVHMILAGADNQEARGPGCAGVTRACAPGSFDPNAVIRPTQGSPYPYSLASWQQQPENLLLNPLMYQLGMMTQTMMTMPLQQNPVFSSTQPQLPSIPPSQPTTVNPRPIYATSTFAIPSASVIIIQPTTISPGGSTLISWSSVGMKPDSCVVTQNGEAFADDTQGSKILSSPITDESGTISITLNCSNYSGINQAKDVILTVR